MSSFTHKHSLKTIIWRLSFNVQPWAYRSILTTHVILSMRRYRNGWYQSATHGRWRQRRAVRHGTASAVNSWVLDDSDDRIILVTIEHRYKYIMSTMGHTSILLRLLSDSHKNNIMRVLFIKLEIQSYIDTYWLTTLHLYNILKTF